MQYRSALRRHRVRFIAVIAGLIMIPGLGIATGAPQASATTGGGCQTTYSPIFNVTACISAQGNVIYPDGYVSWNTTNIPSGCMVSLFVQNSSGQNVARYNDACGYYHYGPFPRSVLCLTNWRTELVVYSNSGNVGSYSKFVFVDPGPGGGC